MEKINLLLKMFWDMLEYNTLRNSKKISKFHQVGYGLNLKSRNFKEVAGKKDENRIIYALFLIFQYEQYVTLYLS